MDLWEHVRIRKEMLTTFLNPIQVPEKNACNDYYLPIASHNFCDKKIQKHQCFYNFLALEAIGFVLLFACTEILLIFVLSENCKKVRLVFFVPISCIFGRPGLCSLSVNGLILQTYL